MQLTLYHRAGWVMLAALALGVIGAYPAASAPAKKAPAKPAARQKPAPKPPSAVGKTPTETVKNLIGAMQKKDRDLIASAFDWQKFASEMNKMISGQGLDAATYKTLLVETLDVEKSVSANLRVGPEAKKGANAATVEVRRVYPSGAGDANQVRTIHILTLSHEKDGWKIIRLDPPQQPASAPPIRQAPQGMVPAAGTEGSR